jgi:hypothetical protein
LPDGCEPTLVIFMSTPLPSLLSNWINRETYQAASG